MQSAEWVKLLIAPSFVVAVTLIGRRTGPSAAGFLAALPVVAGPILALLVVAHGPSFGATSALGSALGTVPTMVFALVYARIAERLSPALCLLASYGAYFTVTLLTLALPISWPTALAVPMLAWPVALRAFPDGHAPGPTGAASPWDLPLRFLATLTLVALVTGFAHALGPKVAGVMTPFPIITATLAAFSHRQSGASTAAALMRGLVRGLASFVVFFWALAFLLTRTSVALSFAAGLTACGTMHLIFSRFRIAAPKRLIPPPEPTGA
jgi:hypothetical protein